MAFLIYCDNKGCGKDQEPLLDVLSDEVYCVECGKTIKSVTSFAKKQMKTLGQIRRDEKKQQAFAVKCNVCKKESPPTVEKNGMIVCSLCKNELIDLPKPFAQVIKNHFRAQK